MAQSTRRLAHDRLPEPTARVVGLTSHQVDTRLLRQPDHQVPLSPAAVFHTQVISTAYVCGYP